jgi:hypothetical protein
LKYQDGLAREALNPKTGAVTCGEYQRRHGVSGPEAERILKGLVEAKLWDCRYPQPGSKGGRPVVEYLPLGDSSLG